MNLYEHDDIFRYLSMLCLTAAGQHENSPGGNIRTGAEHPQVPHYGGAHPEGEQGEIQ